jgi:hypothetical protein
MQSVSLVAKAIRSTERIDERFAMSIPIPHVHALLFELRVKIGIGEGLARSVWYPVVVQDIAAEFKHSQPH